VKLIFAYLSGLLVSAGAFVTLSPAKPQDVYGVRLRNWKLKSYGTLAACILFWPAAWLIIIGVALGQNVNARKGK
jgi:hypothetical protein